MDAVWCVDKAFGRIVITFPFSLISDLLHGSSTTPSNEHRRVIVQLIRHSSKITDADPCSCSDSYQRLPVITAEDWRLDYLLEMVPTPYERGSFGSRNDLDGRGTLEESGLMAVVGELVRNGNGVDECGSGRRGRRTGGSGWVRWG